MSLTNLLARVLAVGVALLTSYHTSNCAVGAEPRKDVAQALSGLDAYLGRGANADNWKRHLLLDDLRGQVEKGADADPEVVASSLARFSGSDAGLKLPPFANMRTALAKWHEELTLPKADELPEAAKKAKDDYAGPSADDKAAAFKALQAEVARLARYLPANRANSTAWRKYLEFDELQTQLKAEKPDLETLEEIADHFCKNQEGLELPVFLNTGDALLRYIDVASVVDEEDAKKTYADELDALAAGLTKYAKDPSEELAAEVGEHLDWLRRVDSSAPLVRAVRHHYALPNLYVRASRRLAAAGIDRRLDEVAPLTDVILGTSIRGTTHLVGEVMLVMLPDNSRALFETAMVGNVNSRTVGSNGPATIYSRGATSLQGSKRVMFDRDGIKSWPAKATAQTRNTVTGVSTSSRLGAVQRTAQQRVAENKANAERVAGQHASERVRTRMDRDFGKQLSKAQNRYDEKFRLPLIRQREMPEVLDITSTTDAIFVKALQANDHQLGAPSSPPEFLEGSDLTGRAHQTMVNNVADGVYAGRTLTRAQVDKDRDKRREGMPDELRDLPPEESDRDWSMTFADSRPVRLTIEDDTLKILVTIAEYSSGERDYDDSMEVATTYKMEVFEGRPRLVRQGDLSVEPVAFKNQQQPTRIIALKTVLRKRFGRFFLETLTFQPLKFDGEWERLGPLDLQEFKGDDGWLKLAWSISPNAPKGPAPPKPAKSAKTASASKVSTETAAK